MQLGPWWFGYATTVGGIVIGIGVKWIIDLVTESSRRKREDRLRFVEIKRTAYGRLLALGTQVFVLTATMRHLKKVKEEIEEDQPLEAEKLSEIYTRRVVERDQSLTECQNALADIMILCSNEVVDIARVYVDHLIDDEPDADGLKVMRGAFRVAARLDLGVEKV